MNVKDLKVFVVGPNVWGKGDTVDDAWRNAFRPKQYVAYICHPGTTVDPVFGGFSFPVGDEKNLDMYVPKPIKYVGVKDPAKPAKKKKGAVSAK